MVLESDVLVLHLTSRILEEGWKNVNAFLVKLCKPVS